MTARTATPCPRCDYDLSGARDSWTDSCPLEGRCPECGLDIRWASLLSAVTGAPGWSFEHAQSRPFRKWRATLFRSVRPGRLWTELRLEHPIVPKRLLLLITGLCVAVHLLAACMGAIRTQKVARDTVWSNPPTTYSGRWTTTRHTERPYDFIPGFLWPYGWPGFGADANWQDWFERHRIVRPPSIFRTLTYPMSWLAMLALCALLTPLSLLCAPDTLRGCRVRRAHFLRAWVYALPSVAAVAVTIYILESLSPRNDNWLSALTASGWTWRVEAIAHKASLSLPSVWIIWYGSWWGHAVKDYLRLPQPRRTSLSTLAIGALASYGIVGYFPGSNLINYSGELLYYLQLH